MLEDENCRENDKLVSAEFEAPAGAFVISGTSYCAGPGLRLKPLPAVYNAVSPAVAL